MYTSTHTEYKGLNTSTITTTIMKQKCNKCLYEWDSIKKKPKACPRCKTRLDIK